MPCSLVRRIALIQLVDTVLLGIEGIAETLCEAVGSKGVQVDSPRRQGGLSHLSFPEQDVNQRQCK